MEDKQIKLLLDLAKKLKSEKRDRKTIVSSLQSAKILTKNENFTKHYQNLGKVVSIDKIMYNIKPNLYIGFHGCDKSVRDELVESLDSIKKSAEKFDWLGHGFYLWENNYDRALK